MNTDFNVVIEFLDQFGPEASARQMVEPATDSVVLLERFVRGECSEKEREDVCKLLRLHPAWLRWVADRVRLGRTTALA